MTKREAHLAWRAADDAWHALLKAQFGRDAGDVRYTARGRGEPGSDLRDAHEAALNMDHEDLDFQWLCCSDSLEETTAEVKGIVKASV